MDPRVNVIITGDATGLKGAASDGEKSVNKLTSALASAGKLGLSVGLVATVTQVGRALFDASVSAERLSIALNYSSNGRAGSELAYLRATADRLGLSFDSSAQAYQKFQAAARGTSLEGAGARDVFEAVAGAASTLGLSVDDTAGVMLALQQILSKGVVQSEELRGQIGERLPGAFAAAARAMGVTQAELGKMLERGEIMATDLLPKLAKVLKGDFASAADEAGARLEAAANKFGNAWARMKAAVGDAGISRAVASEMAKLSYDMSAASDLMREVGIEGGGAFAQWGTGLVTLLGRWTGFQKITDSFATLDDRIALTSRRIQGFNDAIEKAGGRDKLPFYASSDLADLERDLRRLSGLRETIAPSPSGDEFRTRGIQRDAAQLREQQDHAQNLTKGLSQFVKSEGSILVDWAEKARKVSTAFAAAITAEVDPIKRGALQKQMVETAQEMSRLLTKEIKDDRRAKTADARAERDALLGLDITTFEARLSVTRQGLSTLNEANERLHKEGLRELNQYLEEKYRLERTGLQLDEQLLQKRIAAESKKKPFGLVEVAAQQGRLRELEAQLAINRAQQAQQASTPNRDFDEAVAVSERRVREENLARRLQDAKDFDQAIADSERATLDESKARSRERIDLALSGARDLVEANRAAAIAMIADDRTRGTVQIAEERRVMLERIAPLKDRMPKAYEEALELVNAAVLLKQRELEEKLKPEWKKLLDGWSNTTKLMQDAFDNSMTGALKSAEDAFVSFVQTGKLSFRSLVDSIIADMARAQFRRLAAGGADFLRGFFGGDPSSGDISGSSAAGGGVQKQSFVAGTGSKQLGAFSTAGELRPLGLPSGGVGSAPKTAGESAGGGVTYNVNISGDATAQTAAMLNAALVKFEQQRRRAAALGY